MANEQREAPPLVTRGAYLQTILPMAVGIPIGRIASDGVRDRLGWWGSVGVGILVAMAAGVIPLVIVKAWRQRGDRA